jgi:hypothetical protein
MHIFKCSVGTDSVSSVFWHWWARPRWNIIWATPWLTMTRAQTCTSFTTIRPALELMHWLRIYASDMNSEVITNWFLFLATGETCRNFPQRNQFHGAVMDLM